MKVVNNFKNFIEKPKNVDNTNTTHPIVYESLSPELPSNSIFITFDPFYKRSEYNKFLDALKFHNISFREYVCVKPPYYFYIRIAKEHSPVFLKFQTASASLERYMIEKLIPLLPNQEYILRRRDSDTPGDFERFISPEIFKKLRKPEAEYAAIFRYRNKEQLIKMSKDLGDKIYVLGQHREWKLAFSFNKYIKNHVYLSWILLEKTKPGQFGGIGEFEAEFNYKILVKTKLENKLIYYPYFKDGQYFPLQAPMRL